MTGSIQYPAGYDYPLASATRHLLNTIVATYGQHGTDLPERRFVAIGQVSVDKPLVAVMFGGVQVGLPGNEQNEPLRGDNARTVVLNVELWRTTPTVGPSGRAPDSDEISAAAEVTMNDCWLLMEAAFASDQFGTGIIANATVNAPQGGLDGVTLAVEMQVP